MDARSVLFALMALFTLSTTCTAQVFVGPRSLVQTQNFRVYARSAELANDVARSAEENRKQLALHWLGRELPSWSEPCPLVVNDGPGMPASGETKYTLDRGDVGNFQMSVSGTRERILDSVLPHEITHTVMASHFAAMGKPLPRWADEGACTTVEHQAERGKHDEMLVRFLSEGRGIPFAVLFALKDYPQDMMPLYAQGYSLSCFLICQGGPRRFVQFLERGMETEDWASATNEFYQYPKLGNLQNAWNDWVRGGGGQVDNYTAESLGVSTSAIAANTRNPVQLASATTPTIAAINNLPNNLPNNSLATSTGSYYLDQFRQQQSIKPETLLIQAKDSFIPATKQVGNIGSGAVPQSVSLPAPFQTIGGGIIRR